MNEEHKNYKLTIRGETNRADVGVLACDVFMLGIFLWNQIWHGMDMLFLIVPLTVLGIYMVMFCLTPETYCFSENSLEILHKFRKEVQIPYENVFNYECSARDSFLNITQQNVVKVYYAVSRKKKATICRPRDPERFTEALKANCSVFAKEEGKSSRLEVFFTQRDAKKKDGP